MRKRQVVLISILAMCCTLVLPSWQVVSKVMESIVGEDPAEKARHEKVKQEILEEIYANQQLWQQVRNDVGLFAGAENRFFRQNGRYATMEELRQFDANLPADTRGPFTYTIDVVNDLEPIDFHVIARDSRNPKHPKIMGPDLRLRQGPIAEIYIKP